MNMTNSHQVLWYMNHTSVRTCLVLQRVAELRSTLGERMRLTVKFKVHTT